MSSEATATAEKARATTHGHGHHGRHGSPTTSIRRRSSSTPASSESGLFLAQELLFFGGLFVAYGIYRRLCPRGVRGGEPSARQDHGWHEHDRAPVLVVHARRWRCGRHAARQKRARRGTVALITILCACIFPGDQVLRVPAQVPRGTPAGAVLHPHLEHLVAGAPALPPPGSFFSIYFMMTGVHGAARHHRHRVSTSDLGPRRNNRGEFSRSYFTPVDIGGAVLAPRRPGVDLSLPAALPDLKLRDVQPRQLPGIPPAQGRRRGSARTSPRRRSTWRCSWRSSR